MNLLDNELVLKFFGCAEGFYSGDTREDRAYRILQSMQEPIKKGERILVWSTEGQEWREDYALATHLGAYHLQFLRLPDEFQQPEFKLERRDHCPTCGALPWAPPPEIPQPFKAFIESKSKDEVEEKIEKLSLWHWGLRPTADVKQALRELVELAANPYKKYAEYVEQILEIGDYPRSFNRWKDREVKSCWCGRTCGQKEKS